MKLGSDKNKVNLRNCIQHIRWKYPSTQQFSKAGLKKYVGHYLTMYKLSNPPPHTMREFTTYLERTINLKASMEEEEKRIIEPTTRQILDTGKP